MHKEHQYAKNKAFMKRIKELEEEVEYYKEKLDEVFKVRARMDTKKKRCQNVSEM